MLLISLLKWWFSISHPQELLKLIELNIFMKDPKMMKPSKLCKLVIPTEFLWCTSLKWCPPPINLDSLHLEESSLVPSKLEKKLESWDLTIPPVKKMIFMSKPFKEPFLWWVEPSNISLMFLAETLSDLSELINISWKPVPSHLMKMLTVSDLWNIPSLPSLELPLKLKTLLISLNWLMDLKN